MPSRAILIFSIVGEIMSRELLMVFGQFESVMVKVNPHAYSN